ncbi:MAG: Glycosyltransferase involved in cell wall bisynthesis [Verrucomicrobia bacterium]|nr:MAG: Glycosyltransferase involved in cell wall bisynthesis [Verrucomicrobiota bacterium]
MTLPQITIVVPGRWHAFDLARELEQLGALHRLVTNYPRSYTRRWNIPDAKVVSLPVSAGLTKVAWKVGGEAFAMRQQFRINDLFAHHAARHLGNPDLVHAWSAAAEPALEAARARGIPTVLERSSSHMLEQCRILREEYASLGLRWEETPRLTVERELREYQLADRIFVPSRFVHQTFLEAGFPPERLFLNGFGVDVSRFSPGTKTDDVFRVIFAGSLSVRKGIHHLVAAFRRAAIPNSELLLVGGATAETAQLVGPLDARICRIGHVPQNELPAWYQKSSVFVMPSIEEGQAMVQAQALACGLPLICTANTGGEDFLALDGEGREVAPGLREFAAGLVVPADDSVHLAAALQRLAANPDRLAAMSRAAAALARRDLSWRRYAAANLQHYGEVIAAATAATKEKAS